MNPNGFDGLNGFGWVLKGYGHARRPAPEPPTEPHSEPEPVRTAEEEDAPSVILSDLKWARNNGILGAKSPVSVLAEIPVALKHVTRIVFSLFAVDAGGKRQPVSETEGHVKDGKAEAEIHLPFSEGKDESSEPERTFICVAKHRDSEPLESARHAAKAGCGFTVHLEDAKAWKATEYEFRLSPSSGDGKSVMGVREGVVEGDKLLLRFTGLEASESYSLEIRSKPDEKEGNVSRLRQEVFKLVAYGEWEKSMTKATGEGPGQ